MKALLLVLGLMVGGLAQAERHGGGRPTPPGPRPAPHGVPGHGGHGHPGHGPGHVHPGHPGHPGHGSGHVHPGRPGHGGYPIPVRPFPIRPVPVYPQPFPYPYPQPFPRPSHCGFLGGTYVGLCRSTAGTSAISFTVVDNGAACVVTNSTYFAPAILSVSGAQGYAANLVGTGVAINNTQLTVYGNGQFQFSGYNYAGRFHFNCAR